MVSDRVVINLDQWPRKDGDGRLPANGSAPSDDTMASSFLARFGRRCRYVAPWHRWIKWDRKRWVDKAKSRTKDERKASTTAYVVGDASSARRATSASA